MHHLTLNHAVSLFHETMNATVLGKPTDDSSDGEETNADDPLPMMWDAVSVERLTDKLRQDIDMYMWWAENFWPRVVGQEKWKLDITSGNKKPSNLVTISSDEALALLLFKNHFLSWKGKAESEDDARSQTSSITSSDMSTCMKKYKRNNGSTKDGCS